MKQEPIGKMPKITDKTYLAKGKRGIAYTAKLNGRTVLVKEKNPESVVNTLEHEAKILQAVNKVGIGPQLIACDSNQLIREFVDGPEILDWIPTASRKEIIGCILEIVRQCREMDLLEINKLEMNHPYKHILITRNEKTHTVHPVMIDFDRSRSTAKPKNITQVLQWLTGKEVESHLCKKDINLPREALLAHAKQYKKEYSRIIYEHIIENIRNA